MELHFNFKGLFCFCVGLMICQMMYGLAFGVGVGVLGIYLSVLAKKNRVSIIDFVFVAGFLVNLWYVTGLSVDKNQYDYYNYFTHGVFFVENDFFVKKPMDYVWGAFYHPPFWGLICGITIKIGNLLGLDNVLAYDKVRFINLFAISAVWVVAWKFFNLFDFKKKTVLWGWAGFVFLPIHTIMAGLNNNDSLMYLFMSGAIYQGYLWYKEDNGVKRSLVIAGLVIGAGMTKLSGVMVIVFLGMLGIGKLINKKVFFDKKLWCEFFIIGMGAVIGFAWGGILLYFDHNIVPPPQNVDFISLKGFSLSEKLFDFSNIFQVFPDIWNGGLEHNVWLSLIKTSIFGEWMWSGYLWAVIVYVLAIVMAVFVAYSFGGLFKYQLGKDFGLNLAIIVYCIVVMALWAFLWSKYPYFCSTEFRYIISLVGIAFLWMMNWIEHKNLSQRWLKIIACLIVVFCVSKAIIVISSF